MHRANGHDRQSSHAVNYGGPQTYLPNLCTLSSTFIGAPGCANRRYRLPTTAERDGLNTSNVLIETQPRRRIFPTQSFLYAVA